jgi:glycosyltransferase involved in cell wall biosynthesis
MNETLSALEKRTKLCFDPFTVVTIAICTRNRAQPLKKALSSLVAQLTPEAEILVVDTSSKDETPDVVARLAAEGRRIRYAREDRRGIALARNRALEEARGAYVLFFDDDQTAEPGWLQAYLKFFSNPPSLRVGCVGGPYISRPDPPPPSWMAQDYGAFNLGGEQRVITGRAVLAGGNCAYQRESALKVGGFDPVIDRCEDTEMNFRLRESGYEIWWLPDARIRHWIDPERFRIGPQFRVSYGEGYSMALIRWRRIPSVGARALFWAGRMVITPAQLALQTIMGLLCLAAGSRRTTVNLLLRFGRTAGFARQLSRLPFRPANPAPSPLA